MAVEIDTVMMANCVKALICVSSRSMHHAKALCAKPGWLYRLKLRGHIKVSRAGRHMLNTLGR